MADMTHAKYDQLDSDGRHDRPDYNHLKPLPIPKCKNHRERLRIMRKWLVREGRVVIDGRNMAEDRCGNSVHSLDKSACRLCLLAAAERVGLDAYCIGWACNVLGINYHSLTRFSTRERITARDIECVLDRVEQQIRNSELAKQGV